MTTVWLSVREAARRIGIHPNRLRELIHSGAIPAIRAGTGRTSGFRITEQAADDYITRRTCTHPDPDA